MPDPNLEKLAESAAEQLPELVLGIVRAQGADTDKAMLKRLEAEMVRFGFHPVLVDIADLIEECAKDLPDGRNVGSGATRKWATPGTRVVGLMGWGDVLREGIDPSVSAMMAITQIALHRDDANAAARKKSRRGIAYIVRTLIQPAEVARLRSVYKQRFFLVGMHQDRDERLRRIARRLIENGTSADGAQREALQIVQVDEGITESSAGSIGLINVVNTFEQADVFLTVGRYRTMKRFCGQIFGNPHGAPTVPEMAMGYAYLAAKQSVSMGRSVGASIISPTGEVIAVGCNEAARAGGGTYSEPVEDGASDHRDHAIGHDTSDVERISALYMFLKAISELDEDTLLEIETESDIEQGLTDDASERRNEWLGALIQAGDCLKPFISRENVRLLPVIPSLGVTRIMNLIEFGRSTHAEMAAITDAARRGVAIRDCHMFVTTFPCHECTRNIVAAGIASLTFVQPYPKSLASELYRDSVDFLTEPVDPASWNAVSTTAKVRFSPYEGISPKRFDELFSLLPRKHGLKDVARDPTLKEGGVRDWPAPDQPLRNSIRGYSDADNDPHFEVARQLAEQSVIQDLNSKYAAYRQTLIQEAATNR